MEQCFKKSAVSLGTQDIHHCFVARGETKLKIASFDPEHMGRRSRISHESFLRGNFGENLLPQVIRVG